MKKKKILIVEDESIVALDLKSTVKLLGYEVTSIVSNFNDAIESVISNEPSMVIMDINLKNSKDGIETATEIKKIKEIPILYLTAYSDEETINRAILTNPVGYLNKPFKRENLSATLKLAFYKISNNLNFFNISNMVNIGSGYYFDQQSQELFFKEIPIKLSSNEKLLIDILIKNKGNPVSSIQIEYYIWPTTTVSDSSLRTLIYRIRTKLDHKVITTVPYYGFKIDIVN